MQEGDVLKILSDSWCLPVILLVIAVVIASAVWTSRQCRNASKPEREYPGHTPAQETASCGEVAVPQWLQARQHAAEVVIQHGLDGSLNQARSGDAALLMAMQNVLLTGDELAGDSPSFSSYGQTPPSGSTLTNDQINGRL